jgi:hypothetical protein
MSRKHVFYIISLCYIEEGKIDVEKWAKREERELFLRENLQMEGKKQKTIVKNIIEGLFLSHIFICQHKLVIAVRKVSEREREQKEGSGRERESKREKIMAMVIKKDIKFLINGRKLSN